MTNNRKLIGRKLIGFFISLILLFTNSIIFAGDNSSYVNDSAITASVKTQMLADKNVSATKINVETKNGIVYLSGTAATIDEASAAVQIAESTSGVISVDTTQLSIEGNPQPVTDTYITAKVKGILIREKVFGDEPIAISDIKVETKNGVVYLRGSIDNKNQEKRAINLTKSIAGVKKVVSQLRVRK